MNATRFKQAIAIIEEIPYTQLKLDYWQDNRMECQAIRSSSQVTCGTIACAAGWLALSPEMQEEGLMVGHRGAPMYLYQGIQTSNFYALQLFFDIRDVDADSLFGSRSSYECLGSFAKLTDKEIWLWRAKQFLARYEETV